MKRLNDEGVIVVTLGERGLIYEEDGIVKTLDAYDVETIDTTVIYLLTSFHIHRYTHRLYLQLYLSYRCHCYPHKNPH